MIFKKLRAALINCLPFTEARNALQLEMFKKLEGDNRAIVQSKYSQIYILFEPESNIYFEHLIEFVNKLRKKERPLFRKYDERPISFAEYVFYNPYLYVLPKDRILTYTHPTADYGERGNTNNIETLKYSITVLYKISTDIKTKVQLNTVMDFEDRFSSFFNDADVKHLINESIHNRKENEPTLRHKYPSGEDIYDVIKTLYESESWENESATLIIQNCYLFLEEYVSKTNV